jgi:hypothetical protein
LSKNTHHKSVALTKFKFGQNTLENSASWKIGFLAVHGRWHGPPHGRGQFATPRPFLRAKFNRDALRGEKWDAQRKEDDRLADSRNLHHCTIG